LRIAISPRAPSPHPRPRAARRSNRIRKGSTPGRKAECCRRYRAPAPELCSTPLAEASIGIPTAASRIGSAALGAGSRGFHVRPSFHANVHRSHGSGIAAPGHTTDYKRLTAGNLGSVRRVCDDALDMEACDRLHLFLRNCGSGRHGLSGMPVRALHPEPVPFSIEHTNARQPFNPGITGPARRHYAQRKTVFHR